MPEFIRCDSGSAFTNAAGTQIRCRISDGAELLTQAQVIDQYAANNSITGMSITDVQMLMPSVLLCFSIAFAYRQLSKVVAFR